MGPDTPRDAPRFNQKSAGPILHDSSGQSSRLVLRYQRKRRMRRNLILGAKDRVWTLPNGEAA
jgi:hypothetical protein